MSSTDNLSEGDFLYQSDQELFLVVTGETEHSYEFAVHGWREISKDRLDEYVSHESGKLYKQDDISEIVEKEADDEQKENFKTLQRLFQTYSRTELTDEGPHTEFKLDDSSQKNE